ncbi:response regulator receiver domain-containing protein [Thiogranum longum]|uniref:Response regulator receiver domain-containing protein n=1 Tax=Thiogranum longum TaxID=1537524 RepID=A0A4R1H7T7_9GAMM|nr:response regulator [Thiogranum longum]TCK17894.1 response regulator receiver domain-containing protein [Thiogranum longum]
MESAANKPSDRTVLVVDDEEDIRELYALILEKLGYTTLLSSTSDEAIRLYRHSLESGTPINIVILDLNIPADRGGKEIATILRELDPQARLIVSSGDTTAVEMTHYAEHGFNGALEKTFDRENIKRTLEQTLA